MKLHIKCAAAFLALALMSALAPAALAEDTYAMVTSSNARVYANFDLSGASIKIPKFLLVTLQRSAGSVSEISLHGQVAYIASAAVSEIDTSSSVEMAFCENCKVFEQLSASSRSAKVSAGTKVNVITSANGVALIERGGLLGFAPLKSLEKVSAKPTEPAPTPTPTPAPAPEIVYDEFDAVVTSGEHAVYASASTSADLLGKLKKGDILKVTAYAGKWARVSYNSKTGYCLISGLEKYVAPKPTKPSIEDVLNNSDYSNEKKIFLFLKSEMGFNSAAACGVLANVERESGFRPTAYNSGGGSYGICQWTGGRYTNLKNWCADNGYDYTTLEGQLRFLKHELEKKYTGTYNYLKSVDDSAQGAYDAGYYWCYYFEVPANRTNSSIQRGNIAKDSYWPKYR